MKRFFEIFRAGNYPQSTFSAEDVKAIAENYDSSFLEAPITLDHGWGGPAYGWIDELKAEGKRLLASFKDVSDELTSMVANKSYKTHSVEIYNDIEGKGPYLKALAMLGASSPQVKGMAPIEFSQFSENFPDGESATVDFDQPAEPEQSLFSELLQAELADRDLSPETFAGNTGTPLQLVDDVLDGQFDDQVSDDVIESVSNLFETFKEDVFGADFLEALKAEVEVEKYQTDEPKTFTEKEVNEKLATFEKQIKNLTNELADQKQTSQSFKNENEEIKFTQRKADFVSFVEKQIKDEAKLPPKLKGKVVGMFGHLDGMEAQEDGKPTPLELLKEIIDGLPTYDFDEQAPKGSEKKDFNNPQKLAAAAGKYQQEQKEAGNNITLGQAISHIKNQNNS